MAGYLFGADWRSVLMPTTPLAEIFVRGTLVYLALFLLLRFVLKREIGAMGIADLLLIVLLADAAQNAMGAGYTSISDGLLLVGTLIFWNYALDYAAYHSAALRKVIKPPPLKLVENGNILHDHLAKEKITEEELMSALRGHGLAGLDKVREVRIEPDGMISVLTRQPRDIGEQRRQASIDEKREKPM